MDDAQALKDDLTRLIVSAQDVAGALAGKAPSRELSLAFTKLEEAELWLSRATIPFPTLREAA